MPTTGKSPIWRRGPRARGRWLDPKGGGCGLVQLAIRQFDLFLGRNRPAFGGSDHSRIVAKPRWAFHWVVSEGALPGRLLL